MIIVHITTGSYTEFRQEELSIYTMAWTKSITRFIIWTWHAPTATDINGLAKDDTYSVEAFTTCSVEAFTIKRRHDYASSLLQPSSPSIISVALEQNYEFSHVFSCASITHLSFPSS